MESERNLLGFQQGDTIEAWVPLFLFSVLFGLSMDYQVFLLSRIRERYDECGDTTEAVTFGVASTARIITGAALIIVAVFAGFARGDLIMFQQMGFGVAVALLLDATIIRSVLLPSAMRLLGDWNWYLPQWLAWLPRLQVEGASTSVGSTPVRPTGRAAMGSATTGEEKSPPRRESAMTDDRDSAHWRLAALVGQWRTEGRTVDMPEPLLIDAVDTYEWLPGGSALLHIVDARVGEEQVKGAEIIGWDRLAASTSPSTSEPTVRMPMTRASPRRTVVSSGA